tara:strand:- start:2524 stop:3774 length:1251 start_codon:yes stop_codon:yes gene_type:complete
MALGKAHKKVVTEVLQQVSPSSEDRKKLKKIQIQILKRIKIPGAKAVVGGSGAKDTWLKDTHDIDIYVKFSHSKYAGKSDELSDILHRYLKKKFPRHLRIHGSRDYFQVNYKGYTIEIVPILSITRPTQAKNITDFSSFHVKYIGNKIRKNKSLADNIRVAKMFARANRFYGAESHIKGFSGYVVELLVSHYGSFLKFLDAASKWKSTNIIGSKRAAERLNWAKKISPLILIDPVQPGRNAAAALSREQYDNIVKLSKSFVRRPSMSFFELKPVDVKKLRRKGRLSIIEAEPITAKRDVAGAKALKAFQHVMKNLSDYDIADSFFDYDDSTATFYLVTKKISLPKEYKHFGPPIDNKKAAGKFRKANKGLKIRVDKKVKKYYVMKKRECYKLHDYIKEVLQSEEVMSRIKNIVILG